jgi:hypothetical protein
VSQPALSQTITALARHTGPGSGVLRVGVPLELPPELLPAALARLAEAYPDTRVRARHLSTVAQVAALRTGELDWFAFARAGSPAWYDELAATLRSHGLDVGPEAPEKQRLIVELKIPAVSAGSACAFAPPGWPYPLPDTVRWLPLAGNPIVRRTWCCPAGTPRAAPKSSGTSARRAARPTSSRPA